MGGKTNQSQRTKNSARPSSSARSAELLQGNKYTFTAFTAGGGETGTLKPALETPLNEEIAAIDPNIQVVLKKLTKKDAVTKGKALMELTQLIEESDIEVVKAVLPLWPRLYKSLYADISHRVRECCQQAHKSFVVKLSKQIAPILKQLCPEWIGSQFDTYAPAASVARGSLATAFPSHKLKDVLAFCHDEILDYVHRLLLVPMPMPADKSYTPEEYEARSERLIYIGLCTYNFYLRHIATGLWKEKVDRHKMIISDGKFWSYAKHKSPQVKAAWLEAIGTILDRTTELLDEFYPKIVSAVVLNLDEADALIQSAAWTCLLRIQLIVPNWIEHTNVEKAFLVKVRKVLSEPNQGLNTHLLPFVSHMNGKVLGGHSKRFFVDFFESLKQAMTKCKSGNAQELKSLVDTYFECLHYVLKQIQTEKDFIPANEDEVGEVAEKVPFKQFFLEQFLISPIQWTVWENGKALEHVARNIGLILGYWSVHEAVYLDLWQGFWTLLEKNVLKGKSGEYEEKEKVTAMNYQIQLMINLRRTDVSGIPTSPKKKKTVRFGGEEDEDKDETNQSQEEAPSSPEINIPHRCNNWSELFSAADDLSQLCVREMIAAPNPVFMKFLYKLLTNFDDERLPNAIDKVMPLKEFVDHILKWTADESIPDCEEMIDLLLTYGVKAVDLQEIVNQLMRVDNYAVKNWTVMKVSKKSQALLSECRSIAAYMEHILMRLINGIAERESCTMVKTYFDKTLTDRPTEGHRNMIEMICSEIESVERVNEQLNYLARHLLKTLTVTPETSPIVTRLFMTIFNLNLSGTDSEADSALKSAIATKRVKLDDNLLALCLDQTRGKLVELLEEDRFDVENVQRSCSLLINGETTSEMLKEILTFETKAEERYLNHICRIQSYLENNTYLMAEEKVEGQGLDSTNHLRSLMKLLKVAKLRGDLCKAALERMSEVQEEIIMSTLMEIIYTRSCGKLLVDTGLENHQVAKILDELSNTIDNLIASNGKPLQEQITEKSLKFGGLWTRILWEMKLAGDDWVAQTIQSPSSISKLNHLKQCVDCLPQKSLPKDALESTEFSENVAYTCLLFRNYFSSDFNTIQESSIIRRATKVLDEIIPLAKSKQLNLMYNAKPETLDDKSLCLAADLAELLRKLLENAPSDITHPQWDFLRIALSSWILTISNALSVRDSRPSLNRFTASVMELFNSLMNFFESERKKSSTQLLSKVQEEWNSVFAREVNTVLLLILNNLIVTSRDSETNKYLLSVVLPLFERVNFIYLTLSKDISKTVSQQQFLQNLVRQLAHPVGAVRFSVLCIIQKLVPQLASVDNDRLSKGDSVEDSDAHYLQTIISPLLASADFDILEYVEEFQYKAPTDTETIQAIPEQKSMAYLYLWNVILELCRKSTPELRAFYAKWIASRGLEGVLLKVIFRLLPQDVLKNFETKSSMVDTYFNSVKGLSLCDKSLNAEPLLVCFTYLNLVRLLPAVVRKCWTNLPHRTNLLIDKFNMFYASALLCQEELRSLVEKREKMDNIQISVHNSTREIIAVYAKEEARMELMITLPMNYPLNVAKVEGGKSINSRLQSKEVHMQLNLFLSHQNGTIFNGLALWKRNLDKKFEGVEECYVCYSVIHQDTYQLPKLSCKTCKKKFHSPCLYRWFSTSNKSTCPICRNIF